MTDTVWIALITAIPPTVASIAAVIITLKTGRKLAGVEVQVEKIHVATNSMKDALVAATYKEGKQVGKDTQIALDKTIKDAVLADQNAVSTITNSDLAHLLQVHDEWERSEKQAAALTNTEKIVEVKTMNVEKLNNANNKA